MHTDPQSPSKPEVFGSSWPLEAVPSGAPNTPVGLRADQSFAPAPYAPPAGPPAAPLPLGAVDFGGHGAPMPSPTGPLPADAIAFDPSGVAPR